MIPTSVNGPGSITQTATTATIGIASLILEGRALSDDDFDLTSVSVSSRLEGQSRRLTDELPPSFYTTRPTNFYSFVYLSSSNETNTSDPTLQHMQRLRQKLGQLRQSSPSTSHGEQLSAEQAITIGLNNRCNNSFVDENDDDDENELLQYPLQRRQSGNKYVHPIAATLQSLASTCLRTAAPRPNRIFLDNNELFLNDTRLRSGVAGSSGCGSSSGVNASTSSFGSENFAKTIKTTSPTTSRSAEKKIAPKQGPHCDQFLRKAGLAKVEPTADVEEHICDMANLNEICYLWQLHCRQIDFIMSTMDPICIEVYLGPENHEILLEQWVIEQKEKSTTPTMTLQSLANAIRSQLYFSQITAWSDLIKNAKPHDREIIEHNRIRLVERFKNGATTRKPRLDIFYRIRAYDSTACFNSKPNVHDFPNVVISENCSISVCLKSLPRIQSGIPRINFAENEINTNNPNSTSCNSSNNNNSCISNNNNSSHTSFSPASTAASCSGCSTSGCSTVQSNSSLDESMVLDDRLNLPCQEKGKHRCAFDEEYANAEVAIEAMPNTDLSHREKQLLKYRKRMMKRDKKTKNPPGAGGGSKAASDAILTTISKHSPPASEPIHMQRIQMGDPKKRCTDDNHTNAHQQPVPEFGSINSYRPPLYCTQETTIAEAVQTNSVEMVSTGTQTPNFPITFPCCENCGNKMEFICLRCDSQNEKQQISISPPHRSHEEASDLSEMCDSYVAMNHSADSGFASDSRNGSRKSTPKVAKGDLLLQAIERTPRHRYYLEARNNNDMKNPAESKINDCQLCKRQKTQHVYRNAMHTESEVVLKACTNGQNYSKPSFATSNDSVDRHMSADCACSNEYGENCCTKSKESSESFLAKSTPISPIELKLCDNIDAQFLTPKSTVTTAFKQSSPKNHHRPSPLLINCTNKLPFKLIPKINLTNIFTNSSATTSSCSSAPIPIASADTTMVCAAFSFDNINNSPDIPVQKSSSAPTLPNSPSLSPRFLKQAAIYKRRSRHLSDRSSERSSIGSDEQFSDEDLESLYSPTSSPVKARMFLKASGFGRRPILGSFEESLFQKRFLPKSQAGGYKVLLGASGEFCPSQLTIPAIASFYELPNESTLSTPYVCEIRLSRKGYTVPRVGTVQATLLNPLGTVVRMFVVPYDFRDMPAMSQTFIRQRVLAVDSVSSSDTVDSKDYPSTGSSTTTTTTSSSSIIGAGGSMTSLQHNVSYGEQMRALRYAIHLRFQTTRTGRLALHTDIRLLISRRTDCDTAAAHAKGALESPNELRIVTIKPDNPKYCARQENPNKI